MDKFIKTQKLLFCMLRSMDSISQKILSLLASAEEPLETKELENLLKNVTRIKLLYRLNWLRGEGKIKGKAIGSGKGAWIWWKKEAFEK